ncbi:MAG: NfeD family protein, partial [Candidatus Aminicenantes bacterium]|nr:NfeD family protein [Candidatus Aminicenantes bacterium]
MDSTSILSMPAEIAWAIGGLILIFLELFIPGLVIAFFGVGALVTALTTWLGISPSLPLQLLVFIICSIVLLVLLRKYMKRIFYGETKAGAEIPNFTVEIGKIVPVIEFIQPGEVGGKVRYQGSNWSAR